MPPRIIGSTHDSGSCHVGSSPAEATNGDMAQLVAHLLCRQRVTSSNLVISTGLVTIIRLRSVAQFGSASGLGPEGRRFESCHSD